MSNQPDGICGYAALGLRMTAGGRLGHPAGVSSSYLFSDRVRQWPGDPGTFGMPQPFEVYSAAKFDILISAAGNGRYDVRMDFGADINRQFDLWSNGQPGAQCVEGAIVGTGPAIGNTEHVDRAIYVVTIGKNVPDPK
ncbi:hypothetical protein [Actinophytocola sp.]|uniref:hypothetical protein n=1 Tax=Actinophytocola sp. TaxID=1872138 RepID=UPI0038998AEC